VLHYLLANNQAASPVFEWIERAAIFSEVLAVPKETARQHCRAGLWGHSYSQPLGDHILWIAHGLEQRR
jgi:hypothetical protein